MHCEQILQELQERPAQAFQCHVCTQLALTHVCNAEQQSHLQVIWLLSGKVSEDIFRKQLERLVGAAINHLQRGKMVISYI